MAEIEHVMVVECLRANFVHGNCFLLSFDRWKTLDFACTSFNFPAINQRLGRH